MLRQPSSRCRRFDENRLAKVYLNSVLHFPKTLTIYLVLKVAYRAGEGPRNEAMWDISRRLKNKVVFNIKLSCETQIRPILWTPVGQC